MTTKTDKYTITELEEAFHNYFQAKRRFLMLAKRYCEQHGVDESHNGQLIEPDDD